MKRYADDYTVEFCGDIEGITDEYAREVVLRRLPDLAQVVFFRDEIKRQQEEIDRRKALIESCYRSLFDYVNYANERFRMIGDLSVEKKYSEEGLERVKMYVEDVRCLLFDDEHCERLRKFNCIAVGRDDDPFAAHESVCYQFSNGKVTFAVKIPCQTDRQHLLSKFFEEDRQSYDLYNYGMLGLSVVRDGEDETIFKTYDILEFRRKLRELVESDFKDAFTGKNSWAKSQEDIECEEDESEDYC